MLHLPEFRRHGLLHLRQVAVAGVRLAGELRLDLPVGARVQVQEGEVFQLRLHPGNAQAVRQRRVDFQRLASHQALLVARHVLQGAQVVQAVGELDEDDPDVLGHGDQHLAEALRLALFLAEELQLAELRYAGNQRRDFRAEQRRDLVLAGVGVFNGVVQQGAGHGHGVHLQFRQNGRHLQGVGYVRDARFPRLVPVRLGGEVVGATDHVRVGLGMIVLDCGDNRINGQHFIVVYGSIDANQGSPSDRAAC